jgi:3-oxoadipate enol-lactonase
MIDFPEVHRPAGATAGAPVILLHGGGVANWMWQPQLPALTDRLVITPDLPGFGTRARELWPGLDAVADDVADRLDSLQVTDPVELVGLSLGGLVGLRVLARHPHRVRSAFVTSVAVDRADLPTRLAARTQLAFWRSRGFWRFQAAAFGLPEDSRADYVDHGLSVRRDTAAAMTAEFFAGGVPDGLRDYTGPLLAVAGERDSGLIRRSLRSLGRAVPQAHLRLAPALHHIWSIEDSPLFDDVLIAWLAGTVDPRLLHVEP